MTHALKTLPDFFEAVQAGDKFAEVRKNDRDFKRGDKMLLQEYFPETKRYSGRELELVITNVVTDIQGLNKQYCLISFTSLITSNGVPPIINEIKATEPLPIIPPNYIDSDNVGPGNPVEASGNPLEDFDPFADEPQPIEHPKPKSNGKKQTTAKAD